MAIKWCGVMLLVIIVAGFGSAFSFNDDDKAIIVGQLIEARMDAIRIKKDEDLQRLQSDLLRKRNHRCFEGRIEQSDELLFKFHSYKKTKNLTREGFINDFNTKCLNYSTIDDLLYRNKLSYANNLQQFADLLLNQMFNEGCNFCATSKEALKEESTDITKTQSKNLIFFYFSLFKINRLKSIKYSMALLFAGR